MSDLSSLMYVSTAAPGTDAAVVERILETASRHNPRRDLTGALLAYAGHFLQVIEGPQSEVNALYQRIERDPRHRNVRLLDFGPLARRRFDGWAMRHVPGPQGHDPSVMGFLSELTQGPGEEQAQMARALMLRLASTTSA
jgi:hypothetical protein